MANMFKFDQFPDGPREVPLTRGEGGPQIGTAVVTFKDGEFTASVTINDEIARELGLDLTYFTTTSPLSYMDDKEALAVKLRDEDW
jgi:hypothetical protein